LYIDIESYADDKDQFKITPVYSSGASSYEGASKSEKFRVDLCVLLAIRDLIENSYRMNSFSQLFVDELFDGLDENGVEMVTSLFKRHFADRGIFIITHDEGLKSYASSVIMVDKQNLQSKISIIEEENE